MNHEIDWLAICAALGGGFVIGAMAMYCAMFGGMWVVK